MAEVLQETQVKEMASEVPDWKVEGKELKQVMKFKDFVTAMDFVNKLIEPAEAAGHHPDIAISYNTVTISLTSHDAGGLTEKDFAMAKQISSLK
ncbi:putative pterin-4-alpha-carbinolamine dehydratase [Lyngbya aestuarii BL J]|uniref:Putative pterin-4-alpha-carbinolamine dehydratase n=1 Tax=Lyngbya aestuarii BL J TaxID=1348334 RepID=U7QSG8_9CYAN|nr:4a-hydroxytetrahydrobiopterin dehydratase [Lyngbya aestuarii]ERT09366.1 putative pterin-4-alpha-carbinolamine dehydratase [Lyngbya aestuarii BL J]